MINVNELRIGNWVCIDNTHFSKISSIQSPSIIRTENLYNKYLDGSTGDEWNATSDFITPIPLTPEILEACGLTFKWNLFYIVDPDLDIEEDFMQNKYDFVFKHLDNGQFQICNGTMGDEYSIGVPFKYLHQLQNLFFALTGQELEVKTLSPSQ